MPPRSGNIQLTVWESNVCGLCVRYDEGPYTTCVVALNEHGRHLGAAVFHKDDAEGMNDWVVKQFVAHTTERMRHREFLAGRTNNIRMTPEGPS